MLSKDQSTHSQNRFFSSPSKMLQGCCQQWDARSVCHQKSDGVVLKDTLFLSRLQVLSYSGAGAPNLIQHNWNTMPKYFIPDSYLLRVILENLRILLKNKAQSNSWMLKMATTINEGHILASGFINIVSYFIFKYKDTIIGFGLLWGFFSFVLFWGGVFAIKGL